MSILTSIAGPSGSGKTRSFKNLNWDETFVIRPNRKPFSFPGSGVLKPWDSETKTGDYAIARFCDKGALQEIVIYRFVN